MEIYLKNELIYNGERVGLTLYHLHAKSNIVIKYVVNIVDPLDTSIIAHPRTGYINMRTLRWMHHKKIVDGLNLNLTDVIQVQKTHQYITNC